MTGTPTPVAGLPCDFLIDKKASPYIVIDRKSGNDNPEPIATPFTGTSQ
jgi:hypothetical protein